MNTIDFAREIRILSLELCHTKKTSHIGGSFSIADILAVLYNEIIDLDLVLNDDINRDRVFYSKGHACVALYSALSLCKFFTKDELLKNFTVNGTYFTSHVNHNLTGIELSTGSLGHALGVACGSAVAEKRKKIGYSIFSILSDGELDEGSNWEAIMFAAHHKLDNLILIVDYNKIQSFGRTEEVIQLEPLADKFKAFNWEVHEIDGHSINDIKAALLTAKNTRQGKPKCLIAHTEKGKGVRFMENQLLWHYKSPNEYEYEKALTELKAKKDAQ